MHYLVFKTSIYLSRPNSGSTEPQENYRDSHERLILPNCNKERVLVVSLAYFSESGAIAGADNAMNKHMLSWLSFDKNKGFTLESGQFKCAIMQDAPGELSQMYVNTFQMQFYTEERYWSDY